MNETSTLGKTEKEAELPKPLILKNNINSSLENYFKKWIKKNPFFPAMDYLRRKAYDSPLFDGSVRPLAKTLEKWPGALLIDVTNRCNAKCVWCPNPDLTNLGAMHMDVYRKIIDDFGSCGGVVTFGTFGEPLMDKHMQERLSNIFMSVKLDTRCHLSSGCRLRLPICESLRYPFLLSTSI